MQSAMSSCSQATRSIVAHRRAPRAKRARSSSTHHYHASTVIMSASSINHSPSFDISQCESHHSATATGEQQHRLRRCCRHHPVPQHTVRSTTSCTQSTSCACMYATYGSTSRRSTTSCTQSTSCACMYATYGGTSRMAPTSATNVPSFNRNPSSRISSRSSSAIETSCDVACAKPRDDYECMRAQCNHIKTCKRTTVSRLRVPSSCGCCEFFLASSTNRLVAPATRRAASVRRLRSLSYKRLTITHMHKHITNKPRLHS